MKFLLLFIFLAKQLIAMTPTQDIAKIRKAIKENNYESFNKLAKTTPLNRVDEKGRTLFHVWAKAPYRPAISYAIFEKLLTFKELIDQPDKKGVTPLMFAVSMGSSMHVNKLFDEAQHRELPINVNAREYDQGLSLLHLCVVAGDTKCYNLLLTQPGLVIDLWDNQGFTALHYAVRVKSLNMVSDLLKNKADPNLQDHKTLRTPLHYAIADGFKAIALAILQSQQCKVELQDYKKRKVLHLAAKKGLDLIVSVLLMLDHELDVQDNNGDTPLHLIIKRANASANTTDSKGKLVAAAVSMVAWYAKPDIQNNLDDTALHLAAENGLLGLSTLLIDKKANLNLVNIDGSTALHLAAENDHWDIVEKLIESGADINVQDNYGNTVLHWAANTDMKKIIVMLLRRGANGDVVNKKGLKVAGLIANASLKNRFSYIEEVILFQRRAD